MVTGILSVFTAVLPMGIAFATGTPLQGSLGWGMSVINGGKKEDTSSSYEIPEETEGESKTQIVLDNGTIIEIDRASGEISTQTQQEAEEGQQTLQTETEAPPAPKGVFKRKAASIKAEIRKCHCDYGTADPGIYSDDKQQSGRLCGAWRFCSRDSIGFLVFYHRTQRTWGHAHVFRLLYGNPDNSSVCGNFWLAAAEGWSKVQYLLCSIF